VTSGASASCGPRVLTLGDGFDGKVLATCEADTLDLAAPITGSGELTCGGKLFGIKEVDLSALSAFHDEIIPSPRFYPLETVQRHTTHCFYLNYIDKPGT
jgi:hypothetical protein